MTLTVVTVPAFEDNYLYLLRCDRTGVTAAVDPGEAKPINAEPERRGWSLDIILTTHHHWDHTGGIAELHDRWASKVYGSAVDKTRIPRIDNQLEDGAKVRVGAAEATVLFVPGHTRGHIAYYFADDEIVFCGDTLFSIGCGRLFEGSAADMWRSLSRLRALPSATRVYCAHEYTQANVNFALSIEPENLRLKEFLESVKERRRHGQPTMPSTIAIETELNPFLRADDPAIAKLVGTTGDPVATFAELRRRKDHFR